MHVRGRAAGVFLFRVVLGMVIPAAEERLNKEGKLRIKWSWWLWEGTLRSWRRGRWLARDRMETTANK
jgi:hypothetical protein